MSQEKLTQQLENLHQTLQQQQSIDDKTTDLLKQISQDIENLKENIPEYNADSTVDTLEQSLVHFEQDHPTIAGVLKETIDLLNKMGI